MEKSNNKGSKRASTGSDSESFISRMPKRSRVAVPQQVGLGQQIARAGRPPLQPRSTRRTKAEIHRLLLPRLQTENSYQSEGSRMNRVERPTNHANEHREASGIEHRQTDPGQRAPQYLVEGRSRAIDCLIGLSKQLIIAAPYEVPGRAENAIRDIRSSPDDKPEAVFIIGLHDDWRKWNEDDSSDDEDIIIPSPTPSPHSQNLVRRDGHGQVRATNVVSHSSPDVDVATMTDDDFDAMFPPGVPLHPDWSWLDEEKEQED